MKCGLPRESEHSHLQFFPDWEPRSPWAEGGRGNPHLPFLRELLLLL